MDVGRRLLVTCRHVVADRKTVDVYFPLSRNGELVTDRAEYLRNRVRLRERGLLVAGKALKTTDELDLALLELESLPPGTRAVTLRLPPPQPGEPLRLFGNRLDLDTVWNLTAGPARVSGRLADGYFWRGKKLAVNADVLIGQLPTEEGDSGGPVFDSRDRLVGMASALRRQCPLAAVCISARQIQQFAELAEQPADRPKENPEPSEIAESLLRGTVWLRPAATDQHLAGALIAPDLVLTCGRKFSPGEQVGVAFPVRDDQRWSLERAIYRDSLGLSLRGSHRSARVLAHDPDRELALLQLDAPVEFMRPVPPASRPPSPGDPVHAMSHPGGLEFAWVYAGGVIRQRGRIAFAGRDESKRVAVIACQLPAQGGSPGGPVLNDRGELVGILSSRESAQLVAYAVAGEEIAAFLDVVRVDRPPRTLPGLFARFRDLPERSAKAAALGLAGKAEELLAANRVDEAMRACDGALTLDSGCVPARVTRAGLLLMSGKPAEAITELDAAVEKGPFNRNVLVRRAELSAATNDRRKARGDLERVLEVYPGDAEARQRLVGVLVELGEDAKAAAAVTDTLRADPKRFPSLAVDLLEQAASLARKYPEMPSIPADWLTKALIATKREDVADLLNRAAAAKDAGERLAILQQGLKQLKPRPRGGE